jgi:hypothetical protein
VKNIIPNSDANSSLSFQLDLNWDKLDDINQSVLNRHTATPVSHKLHLKEIPLTKNSSLNGNNYETLKIFHQNIRGLRYKTNEIFCHIHMIYPMFYVLLNNV